MHARPIFTRQVIFVFNWSQYQIALGRIYYINIFCALRSIIVNGIRAKVSTPFWWLSSTHQSELMFHSTVLGVSRSINETAMSQHYTYASFLPPLVRVHHNAVFRDNLCDLCVLQSHGGGVRCLPLLDTKTNKITHRWQDAINVT